MKPIFLLLWTALLLLGGCTAQQETVPTAIPATTVPAAPNAPAGIYDAAAAQPSGDGGELTLYPLGQTDTQGIAAMGDDLLVLSGKDGRTLTRFCGPDLHIAAQVILPCGISFRDAAVQIRDTGLAYYDSDRNALVFLDALLQETSQFSLPGAARGGPALSGDLKKLFYCTRDTLRCIDLETGLDRLVRELDFTAVTLTALHCADAVLSLEAEDSGGNSRQLFICTETGRLLCETLDDTVLWTDGAAYFATHEDGLYTELLSGDAEHGPTLLEPYTYNSDVHPLLSRGGVVLATQKQDAGILTLDYYDLGSGARTASVTLSGCEMPAHFIDRDGSIWFVRCDADRSCDILCRWTTDKSATGETVSHFSSRHTAENPDEAGLAACRQMAGVLSQKYGVEILLWTDAVAYQPQDHPLVAEYQVPVIQRALQALDSILALYPDGLLKKAAEGTAGGRIKICLVRSIEGAEKVAGLQYWQDSPDAYLALSVATDAMMQATCRGIFHILESRVMTQCTAYDGWDELNPADFEYSYGHTILPDFENSRWVLGDDRAFIDTGSMSYPREDRARIMEYAMMPGNEALFQTETMQKKLRLLSLGIREAFGMKKTADAFLWEQYLLEPVHYG